MTDANVGLVPEKFDVTEYYRERVRKGFASPDERRYLERLETRQEEVGGWEGLFRSQSGREKGLIDFLPFVGTARETAYLLELADALEAADAGTASDGQVKLLEDYEDFNYRQWTTAGKATGIGGEAIPYGTEFLITGAVGSAGRAGLRKIGEKKLGRILTSLLKPVSKFDDGLKGIIARSQRGAQGTRLPIPFGEMGVGGVAAAGVRAGTTQAAEFTLLNTAIGETYGAAFGGGSRMRASQVHNWLNNKFGGVDMHGVVRVLDNEYGMWTDALPQAFVDNYIENFSENSGFALVNLPTAIKIGLTGKGFGAGVSNRMLSVLGLSRNPVDLGTWSRIGFSGLAPELGEEAVGGAARDAVAALFPELADPGNVEALIDNIVPVTLGLGFGMGAPAALMASRNYVDQVLAYHGASDNARRLYNEQLETWSDADKAPVTSRLNALKAFRKDGFSAMGTGQLAVTEGLKAQFMQSESARTEAQRRVREDRGDAAYRVKDSEITEELEQMIGEIMQSRFMSEDGQSYPVVDMLRQYGVVTAENEAEVIEDATRRAGLLEDVFESGDIDQLIAMHSEGLLARELTSEEREEIDEPMLRTMRDMETVKKLQEQADQIRADFGVARGTQELPEDVEGPVRPITPEEQEAARARIEQTVMGEFLEPQPTEKTKKELKKGLDYVAGTGAEAAEQQQAIMISLDEIAQERGLEQSPTLSRLETDLPGGEFAKRTNAQVLEVEGLGQPAAFDENTGFVYLDRGKLQEAADRNNISLERQSVRSVAHEMLHVRQKEMTDPADRQRLARQQDEMFEEIGLPKEGVAELQDPIYGELSDLQRLEEANSYRTEKLSELILSDNATAQQEKAAEENSLLRKIASDILNAVLPKRQKAAKSITDLRAKMREVGIDEASMDDGQVMGYMLAADGMAQVLLSQDVPEATYFKPALDDPEKIIARGPKEFWDRIRGERPLPRPQRGPVAGAVEEVLLDPTSPVVPTATELETKLQIPSRVVAAEGLDTPVARERSIEAADAVVVYTTRQKGDKAAVEEIKALAGYAKKGAKKSKKPKKQVIVDPTPDQLRRFVQRYSVKKPYITTVGGAAATPAARQSVLGAFDLLEDGTPVTTVAGVTPAPVLVGPYGGLTAEEVARRFVERQELPDLAAVGPEGLPKLLSDADAVIVVGDDVDAWQEVLDQLPVDEHGGRYLDRGEQPAEIGPTTSPTIATADPVRPQVVNVPQDVEFTQQERLSGVLPYEPPMRDYSRSERERALSREQGRSTAATERAAARGYAGMAAKERTPVPAQPRIRQAPVIENPRTVAEMQAYMYRYGVKRPLIVGSKKAVDRAKAMYAEAVRPKDSLLHYIIFDRGGRDRVDPFRESWYGETLDSVQSDDPGVAMVTTKGPVNVNARGEYLYPESEHYVYVGSDTLSEEKRMQLSQIRNADQDNLLDAVGIELEKINATFKDPVVKREVLKTFLADLSGHNMPDEAKLDAMSDAKLVGLIAETANNMVPESEADESYDREVLRSALLKRAMRGHDTEGAPELARAEFRDRSAWRKIDDISYAYPHRLLVPASNAGVRTPVLFREYGVIMPGEIVADEGDSVRVRYLASDGAAEYVRVRRKNLFHPQLSLHLRGEEPVYADGKLVHGGKMTWSRGVAWARPHMADPNVTSNELTLTARDGETPEEFGRRVEEAGMKLMEQYPAMKEIAQQGQHVPEAPKGSKAGKEWKVREGEARANMLIMGKRAMMVDVLSDLIEVRSDIIGTLLDVKLYGEDAHIRVDRSQQSFLSKQFADALANRTRARGEATEDPAQTLREADLRDAFASEIDMILKPVEEELIGYFGGRISLLDIQDRYNHEKRTREKAGYERPLTKEYGLKTLLDAIDAASGREMDLLASRALAMSSSEFEGLLEGSELDPLEILIAKEEAEKRGETFTYETAPDAIQLAAREQVRREDEEALKAERIETDEGGGMAGTGQQGQRAFQRAGEKATVRERSRMRSLPEVAGRMVVIAHNLAHDALEAEAAHYDAHAYSVVRLPGEDESTFRTRLTQARMKANEMRENAYTGGHEWWFSHAENPYFMKLGTEIASTAAHAAVLTPRAISALEVPQAMRSPESGELMRSSALVSLVQGLTHAGIGPTASRGSVKTLHPVPAMSPSTTGQLLEALGLKHRLGQVPKLTRSEINQLFGRKQKRRKGKFTGQFEQEGTLMHKQNLRDLVQAISHGNIINLQEWFEQNTSITATSEDLAQRLKERAKLNKSLNDGSLAATAKQARERLEQGRLSDAERDSAIAQMEAPDKVRERLAQLDQELRVMETRVKMARRLQATNAYKEFRDVVAAYRKRFNEGKGSQNQLEGASALYQGLSRMKLFQQAEYAEALEIARLLAGVRGAILMTEYGMQNAYNLSEAHERERAEGRPVIDTALGMSLGSASNQVADALAERLRQLEAVHEFLEEGRLEVALAALVHQHEQAPVVTYAAHANRVSTTGQVRGAKYLAAAMEKAGGTGQQILIAPRGAAKLHIVLDPNVVYSPEASTMTQRAEAQMTPGASVLENIFPRAFAFDFAGNASPMGVFRDALNRHMEVALRDRVFEALSDMPYKDTADFGDVREWLADIDLGLADEFDKALTARNARLEALGLKRTPQERKRDVVLLLEQAITESTEGIRMQPANDPARPGLGILEVTSPAGKTAGMRILSKVGEQLISGPMGSVEYMIFGMEPIDGSWQENVLGRAEAIAKSVRAVAKRIEQERGSPVPLYVDASNMPDAVRKRLERVGLTLVQDAQRIVRDADVAPASAIGRKEINWQILPPVSTPEAKDTTEKALQRSADMQKQYDVKIPQIWEAEFMPKGRTSDWDMAMFLASYDKWHSDTMWEQMLAMRQHRLHRERLEDFVDAEGVKGFAAKKRLRDLGEAMLVRIDLDYWVHDPAGYSRGSEKLSYSKGVDQSLHDAIMREEGAKKLSDRHQELFTLAKAIRTEAQYAPIRDLIRDMNGAQQRITKMALQAKLIKGGIDSYASLGWKDKKGERVFEPGVGSAVGLLEVGQAGGPFREDIGYRRHEKQLVSVLSGWASGYDLVLPNALDAAARTHRVVAETRYNKAWAHGMEAAGLIKVVPENKTSPGYVRLKADTLSQYQAEPWIADYINNATTQFGLRDIKNPFIRGYMRLNFAAKHLMLMFGFFHHQAFVRSYLFTVSNSEFGAAMKDVKGMGSIAGASLGSYAKAWGRMNHKNLRDLESKFRPMAMGREAWTKLTPQFEMLVRAGMTVQLSNEMTQNMGGAYYTPEDVADVDNWFEKAKAKINSWGIGAAAKPMLTMVENVRIAQRETAEWLFNTMGANMKIAAGLIKFQELQAKHAEKLKKDDGSHLKELARIAAEQVNADFGGLDLRGRSGKMSDYFGKPGPRNPVHQMVLRGLFLAPDWTESNLTAFLGMLKKGKRYATPEEIQNIQKAAYRTMWARVGGRALSMTFLANMLLAGIDDERELADMYTQAGFPGLGDEDAPKATKLRWLDINLSKFSPTESRKFLSTAGHFMDPFKMSVDAVEDGFLAPIQRKGSAFAKGLYEWITGTNYAGRRYNSLQAFMGWNEEAGEYTRDMTLPDGTKVKKGDRRPGRYEGMVTRNSVLQGSVRADEVPMWMFDQATKFVPLQLRSVVDYAMGSHDGLDMLAQMAGVKFSKTYPDK